MDDKRNLCWFIETYSSIVQNGECWLYVEDSDYEPEGDDEDDDEGYVDSVLYFNARLRMIIQFRNILNSHDTKGWIGKDYASVRRKPF
jgi:hypothetical protein